MRSRQRDKMRKKKKKKKQQKQKRTSNAKNTFLCATSEVERYFQIKFSVILVLAKQFLLLLLLLLFSFSLMFRALALFSSPHIVRYSFSFILTFCVWCARSAHAVPFLCILHFTLHKLIYANIGNAYTPRHHAARSLAQVWRCGLVITNVKDYETCSSLQIYVAYGVCSMFTCEFLYCYLYPLLASCELRLYNSLWSPWLLQQYI